VRYSTGRLKADFPEFSQGEDVSFAILKKAIALFLGAAFSKPHSNGAAMRFLYVGIASPLLSLMAPFPFPWVGHIALWILLLVVYAIHRKIDGWAPPACPLPAASSTPRWFPSYGWIIGEVMTLLLIFGGMNLMLHVLNLHPHPPDGLSGAHAPLHPGDCSPFDGLGGFLGCGAGGGAVGGMVRGTHPRPAKN